MHDQEQQIIWTPSTPPLAPAPFFSGRRQDKGGRKGSYNAPIFTTPSNSLHPDAMFAPGAARYSGSRVGRRQVRGANAHPTKLRLNLKNPDSTPPCTCAACRVPPLSIGAGRSLGAGGPCPLPPRRASPVGMWGGRSALSFARRGYGPKQAQGVGRGCVFGPPSSPILLHPTSAHPCQGMLK